MFKFLLKYSVWEACKQLDVCLQFTAQLKQDLAIVIVIPVDSKQVLNIQPGCLHQIIMIN